MVKKLIGRNDIEKPVPEAQFLLAKVKNEKKNGKYAPSPIYSIS